MTEMRTAALALLLLGAAACHDSEASRQKTGEVAKPVEIRLDYATYNPSSLVIKSQGWLESELAKDKIGVRWVFSAGSNKANELLASSSVDFASTAGAAALLARSNGIPLKIVYVFSKPEWTAIVVGENSPIKQVADLKGKKIAATRGTDPFFFLLRSLEASGLTQRDVEIVHLQHSDGRLALQRGDVDAWAGLDPFMASAELREHARLLYRNVDFNSFGTLDVREDFLAKYPAQVARVIATYERARQWILAHPQETAALVAAEAKLEPEVAARQLGQRTGFTDDVGIPGPALQRALAAVAPILKTEKLVVADADPAKALAELVAPAAAQAAIK